MSFETYKKDTKLQFFNQEQLLAERELIDTWDYEIVNSYGIDCWFVSQKNHFPKIKNFPNQNDIFFHAYGEINRPEYNEPFLTRVFTQFTNDLFAINGFGLNADMTTTLIFNKTSFALDGALALADDQTITKDFNFDINVNPNRPIATIKFSGKNLYFKIAFNWKKALKDIEKAEVEEFRADPENLVTPDVYATFKRRYSAKDYLKDYSIEIECDSKKLNPISGKYALTGKCRANFTIKNPWKSYNEFQNKITPSVGDIVLLRGVDNKILKLELTEVETENKTAQGINPLLGSYSFHCTAKPYIADNNVSPVQDPITAPTEINANKLIIQTILNHDASETAGNISEYDKWYTDDDGMDFTDDDIYGGYDLEPPTGLKNPPLVPKKETDAKIIEHSYNWDKYKDLDIQIKIGDKTITYSPDDVYSYIENLLDKNFMDYLMVREKIEDISVDYSMFDNEDELSDWISCKGWVGKNVDNTDNKGYLDLWYYANSDLSADVSAFTEGDRRIYQLKNDESLLNDFISANSGLFEMTNEAPLNGYLTKYGIPFMDKELVATYVDVLNDRIEDFEKEIKYIYVLSAVPKYPGPYYRTEWVTDPSVDTLKINLEDTSESDIKASGGSRDLVKGPLIPIYKFEKANGSRLVTNGSALYYETNKDNALYRIEISSFEDLDDISSYEAQEYNDLVTPMSPRLNWIEADDLGIYFNNAFDGRFYLYGMKDDNIQEGTKIRGPMSKLTYQNDIASRPYSRILSFKSSPYKIYVEKDKNGFYQIKAK